MMETVVNALILFVSLTLLFIWLDRTVSLKVRQMADQVDEKYAQKVMILPLKEKPQIELTETEMKLRERAKERTQTPIRWTTLPHRLRVVHPEKCETSEADAGLGSGTSSGCLDWEEEQLQGQNEENQSEHRERIHELARKRHSEPHVAAWEEVQLLGAGSAECVRLAEDEKWTVRQTEPGNPYFSEGCGMDPDLVPEGMKVN